MKKIPGYTITKKLKVTKYYTVYRGFQESIGEEKSLIFREYNNSIISSVDITKLKHVHKSIHTMDCDYIEKAYEIYESRDEFCLIFKDTGVITLNDFLNNKPLRTKTFLKIAIQLASAISSIHNENIIHSSITPQSIVINKETEQATLENIGLILNLSNEKDMIYNKTFLDNVLPYISPEQTGRVNRDMDYRTDFYSLGVTFYEMITGNTPFRSTDPMEIIHYHIAGNPRCPSEINKDIPSIISDIIMKLISKNSEDRYQSGEGLKVDLANCLHQCENHNKVEAFTLGRSDISKTFQISQKLYGRENEINCLLDSFERVCKGSLEMILVKGYSGIGKSSLVNEIDKPIVGRNGYFIKGKYEQLKKDIPYSAITQAFSELVNQLLTESENKISEWRGNILNSLGSNGQVIVDIVPEIELLIGKQPPMNQLGPEESQNRFNLVFENFIKVFTKKDHPLVIFLDDLQWIDLPSLNLIKLLMSNSETEYFFLIGAYRDNEVDPVHPLISTIDELTEEKNQEFMQPKGRSLIINRISLKPLTQISVGQLIADSLNCNVERCGELSGLVYKKTEGNPFFIRQFLKTIYDEKLLRLDTRNSNGRSARAIDNSPKWQWDMDKIRQMQATDNVVDLMGRRLSMLLPETKDVLKFASCIGSRFELEILAVVYGKSGKKTHDALFEAIKEGCIVLANGVFCFLHDRLQEAAYNLIPEKDRDGLHYKIGKLMYRQLSNELEERIFSIVDQINHGIRLIRDEEERYEIAGLNLIAGKKAKASTAYEAALTYLNTGMKLLADNSWQRNYRLTYELYIENIECEYLNDNFERTEKLFDDIIREARTKIDKATAYMIKINLYTYQALYKEAIELGIEGLRMFGINLTGSPGRVIVMKELIKSKWRLKNHKIENLVNLPVMSNHEIKTVMRIFMFLSAPAYLYKKELVIVLILLMFNLSLKYGNTDVSPYAYISYGCVIVFLYTDELSRIFARILYKSIESSYKFGNLAFEVNKQFGDKQLFTRLNHIFGIIINHWTKHVKENIDYLKISFKYAIENGELIYAGLSICNILTCMIVKGDSLNKIYETSMKYSSFIKKLDYPEITLTYIVIQKLYADLKGITVNDINFYIQHFDEEQFLDQLKEKGLNGSLHYFYETKLMVAYLSDNYEIAIKMALETRKVMEYGIGMVVSFLYYLYYPLTLAAVYENSTAKERGIYLKELIRGQKWLKKLSDNCPENFLHKYLLVSAEIARITGKDYKAMELYDEAIKSAYENEYAQNEAIANELAAKLYLKRGQDKIAKVYMTEAYNCYSRWGATRKLKDLEEKYSQLLDLILPKKDNEQTNLATQEVKQLASLDMASILKASQTLSETIELDKLLFRLMNIVIENAGAQKGYLILDRQGTLYIEAESTISGVTMVDKSVPLESKPDIAHSVINYVKRTKEYIVFGDTTNNDKFHTDPYILCNKPKSLLCMPIVKQTKLVGILYLENSLTSSAFIHERVETLRLLSSQVAISLENAIYYQNLQKLNDELKQLVIAMESIEEAIIITDVNGRIYYTNPSLERIAGYKSEDVAGQNMSIFNNNDDLEQSVYYEMWDTVTRGEVWTGKIVSKKKDNTLYTERLTISPVYDTSGQLINFVAVKKDITRETKLELRLRNKQKLEAIGTLAGGIAHEFNNSLMAIIGYTELTMDELAEDSEERDNLDQALKASYNATTMIQRILAFGHQGEQERMKLNIRPIVKESLKLVRMSLPSTIVLNCNINVEDCEILADPTQIQQVLINLCTNAEHAMREKGGELVIEMELVEVDKDLTVREGLQNRECIKLMIKDSGCGMKSEIIERIFDPFFTTKEIGEGTGMGLAIVHGIIKNHGGAITVESKLDKGTTFNVYFPIVSVKSSLSRELGKEQTPLGREKVLFIDDNEMIANLGSQMLKRLGYSVVAETNSKRALETFRLQPDDFDIIITDQTMPGLIGSDLAEEILKIRPEISIILCTGYSKEINPIKAKEIGIKEFIMKPCNSYKLGNAIRRALGLVQK